MFSIESTIKKSFKERLRLNPEINEEDRFSVYRLGYIDAIKEIGDTEGDTE